MARIADGTLPTDTNPLMQNNLHRALINNPAMAERFYSLANSIHRDSNMPPRVRELGILYVSAKVGSDFEFSHHFKASQSVGVTADEARDIRDGNLDRFPADERAALALADAIDRVCVTEEVWGAAAAYFTPVQLLDYVHAVGFYGYASRLTCTLAVDVDDGFLTIANS